MTPKVIRWRLTWWLANDPAKSRSQWWSNNCKLCAAKRAHDLSIVMARLARVNEDTARWSVATVRGHLTEPQVVANYASHSEALIRRHGC